MTKIPAKLPETGLGRNHARTINQIIEVARALQPIAGINEEVERTIHGVVRRPKGNGGVDESSIVPRWL